MSISKLILFLLILAILTACSDNNGGGGTGEGEKTTGSETSTKTSENTPPSGLALPFDQSDLNLTTAVINPFGPVRFSMDNNIGHGGIDIPLSYNAPIYAVSIGIIVEVLEGSEGGGGKDIKLLIGATERADEGWIFIYEHVVLASGIELNSSLAKGQLVGTVPASLPTNHMQLTYWKNTYNTNSLCWIAQLESSDFEDYFLETIRNTANFISSWNDIIQEGYYPFRAFLDTSNYPDGAQLCYPMGTDVRLPAE
jgi:hypothetical protein